MRLPLHAAVDPVGYPTLSGERAPGILHILLILAATVLGAWPLQAQSIVDGQRVEFTPSPDNDTVVGGVAIVQNYSLNVYVSGSSTITATADLGKPTPDSDGLMRVPFVPLLTTPLQVGVIYAARVSANGPGGSTASAASNTFMLTSSCGTATISPATVSVGPGTATGSVNVTSSCAWSALSNVSWISATGGSPGTGNGVLGYSVDPNTTPSARSGTITIAGNTVTVNQAAACSYTISQTSQSIAAGGGTGSATVTALAGCAWTAASNDIWVTVTSGASGTGSGTVGFSASSNPTSSARSGTLTIAGVTFTVNEAAGCSYAITPTSQALAAGGGSGSVTVTAGAGCPWTATSNDTWITVTSGASGTGNGTVGFAANANTNTDRSATLTVGGQTLTVTQSACSYVVSPATVTGPFVATTGTITVTTTAGCGWTSSGSAPWLTLTGAGSGSGTATYALSVNQQTASRTATVTVAGQQITVTQTAAVPPIAPLNLRIIR